MSIYTKQALVEQHPAYNVFEREADSTGYVNLTASDRLGLKHPRGFFREYYTGSVVSYALQYNEDPIAAVEDAKAKRQPLHWIGAAGACITSHKRAPTELVLVTIGMKVRFEGLLATIQPDHNNNLKFVPV